MVVFFKGRAINNYFDCIAKVIIFGMKYFYLSLQLATKLFTFKTNFHYGVQKIFQSRSAKVLRPSKSHKGEKILYG